MANRRIKMHHSRKCLSHVARIELPLENKGFKLRAFHDSCYFFTMREILCISCCSRPLFKQNTVFLLSDFVFSVCLLKHVCHLFHNFLAKCHLCEKSIRCTTDLWHLKGKICIKLSRHSVVLTLARLWCLKPNPIIGFSVLSTDVFYNCSFLCQALFWFLLRWKNKHSSFLWNADEFDAIWLWSVEVWFLGRARL